MTDGLDINHEYILLTGRSNPTLAKKIGAILKKQVHDPVTIFSDGEIRVRVEPNLRRKHVFIIQPTCPPFVNDYLMELMLMIDAARRASASEIIAVIPYFGYARQDRKEMPRVPISSSAVASLLEHAGADRVLTVDIHAEQEEGFIRGPWDNLYASYALIPAIKSKIKNAQNLVIASPDKGGMVRATGYARLLKAPGIAVVYKERDVNINTKTEAMAMIGHVKGKDVLLVDDMITTGGTIVLAANYIKEQGAKSVRTAITHGLFIGDALQKIVNSVIDETIVTDTVGLSSEVEKHPKVTVVSVAPLLAEAIKRIQSGESISRDLILKPS